MNWRLQDRMAEDIDKVREFRASMAWMESWSSFFQLWDRIYVKR
jgi:hypothetical protein